MFADFKQKYIGDKSFYKHLMVILLPMVVQQGISSFVSLLDNVMVGKLGTEAISGVAIVNQLVFVFNLTLFGGLAGVSIFGAQFFGVSDFKGMKHTFRVKSYFGIALTVIAIVVFALFGTNLISLYLNDSDSGDLVLTLSEALKYLKISLWGLIPFAVVQIYTSSVRETGETVIPMQASVIAILLNLVLNYVFIFGKLGCPAMGVSGAALATVISRFAEMIYLLIRVHHRLDKFAFLKGAFQSGYVPLTLLKSIVKTGTPLLCNEVLWSLGMAMISQAYSTLGLNVVAATNITSTVWNFFCIIMFAMGNAVAIIIGQELGAGEIEKAKSDNKKLVFFTVVTHILIGVLIIATAKFVPYIYNTSDEVRAMTTKLLIIAGSELPIEAYIHVTYFTIRSGGKTFITFLFDCCFTCLVALPLVTCLCHFTDLDITAIYFCASYVNVIKLVIGIIMLKSGFWAKNIIKNT